MILNNPLRCLEIFLSLGKTLGPQEGPPRTHWGSPRGPERVSGEPNDIRHVGYQFYSIFSTENKYRVKAPLNFKSGSHRMTHGGPEGQGPPWGGVSKGPNDIRHFGYQFYSDFSTENKYRVSTYL